GAWRGWRHGTLRETDDSLQTKRRHGAEIILLIARPGPGPVCNTQSARSFPPAEALMPRSLLAALPAFLLASPPLPPPPTPPPPLLPVRLPGFPPRLASPPRPADRAAARARRFQGAHPQHCLLGRRQVRRGRPRRRRRPRLGRRHRQADAHPGRRALVHRRRH